MKVGTRARGYKRYPTRRQLAAENELVPRRNLFRNYAAKKQLKNEIIRVALPNHKLYDANASSPGWTNVDNTGSFLDITPIPQGFTDGQRLGDEIIIRGITLRMMFQFYPASSPAATTASVVNWRILLIRWKLDTAVSTPTFYSGSILEYTSASGSGVHIANAVTQIVSPYAHNNHVEEKNFSVLMDKRFSVSATSSRTLTHKINREMRCTWNAAGTTGKYHIYLFAINDIESATGQPKSSMSWQSRVESRASG